MKGVLQEIVPKNKIRIKGGKKIVKGNIKFKAPSKIFKFVACLALVSSASIPYFSTNARAANNTTQYTYTGNEESFVAPFDGTYTLIANGAQGVNGGLGGSAKGQIDLKKGNTLNITVGGQEAKFGGGKGSNNGGDPTIIKMNGDILLIGAGGGGGSGATDGGEGTGLGGASVGSTAGTAGINGGGGGRSSNYSYSTGYYQDTGYWKDSGYWGTIPGCTPKSSSSECDVWVSTGQTWVSTGQTWVSTGSNTIQGNPGLGGSNYISKLVNNTTSINGKQSGTGVAIIEANYFPIMNFDTINRKIEFGESLEVRGTISDPDGQSGTSIKLYYTVDNGEKKSLVDVDSSTSETSFTGLVPDLSMGDHIIKVWGEDAKNGASNSYEFNVNVKDNTPPTIEIDNLQDGDLIIDKIKPEFNITDFSKPITIKITLDGEKYEDGTPIVESGKHKLVIDATDAVGNKASKEYNFTINKTPTVKKEFDSQTTKKFEEIVFDLNDYFKDVEDDSLTFDAVSDNESAAKATIEESKLILKGIKQGTANITVKASDGHSTKEVTFATGVNTRPPVLSYTTKDLILVDDTNEFELQGTVVDKDVEDVTIKGTLNGIEKSIVIPTTGNEDNWSLHWGSDLKPGVYDGLSVNADDGFGGTQDVNYPHLVVKVKGSASFYQETLNVYADDLSKKINDVTAAEHKTLLDAYYALEKLNEETTLTNLKDAKTKADLLAEGSVKKSYLSVITQRAWEYTTQHLDKVDVEVLAIAGLEHAKSANEALYKQKAQVYKQDTIAHTVTDQFSKNDMQLVIDSANKLIDAQADMSLVKWQELKELALQAVLGDYQSELLETVLSNALQIVQHDTTQISVDSLNYFFNVDGQEKYVSQYRDYLRNIVDSLSTDVTIADIQKTVSTVDALNSIFNNGIENPSKKAITDYLQAVSELVKGSYQVQKENDVDKLELAYLVTYPEKHDKEDFDRLGLTVTENNIESYYPKLKDYVSEIGAKDFTVKDAQIIIDAVDSSKVAIDSPTDQNIKSIKDAIAKVHNGEKLFIDYINQMQDVIWKRAQKSPQDLTVTQLEQLFGDLIVADNLNEYKENLKQYADDKGKTLSKEDIRLVIEATNAVVKAEKEKTMASVDEAKEIVEKLSNGTLKENLLDRLEQVVLSIVTANSKDVSEGLLKYLEIENVNPYYVNEYQNAINDYNAKSKQDIQNVIDAVNGLMAAIKDWTEDNISELEKAKNNLRVSTFKTTVSKYENVLKNDRNAMNMFDDGALNSANSTISALSDSSYKDLLIPSQNALNKLLSARIDLNKSSKDDAQTAINKMAKSKVKEEMIAKWQELQLDYLNSHLDEVNISDLIDLGIKDLNLDYEQDYLDALKQYAEDKGKTLSKEDIQLVIDVINAYNKANAIKDNGSVKEAQNLINSLIEGKLKEVLSKDMSTLYNVLNPYIPTKDDYLKYVQKNPAIVTASDLTKADLKSVNEKYTDSYRNGLENYTKDKGSTLSRDEIQKIIDTVNALESALGSKKASDVQKLQDVISSLQDGTLKEQYKAQLQSLKTSIGELKPINIIEIEKGNKVEMNVQLNRVSVDSKAVKVSVTAKATINLSNPILTIYQEEKGKTKKVLKRIKLDSISSGKSKKITSSINLAEGKAYNITATLINGESEIQAKNSISANELKQYLFLETLSK